MSQILVTGEAKIRDIQGPVVANSGVITALDGAANQYVRGDGTLASFPTSGGGGSSVSYYLNGSVNQGTFGGSTYYQMSKNAIVGTGTNFSTSVNGLLAQFITDANDPDVVSIPSGNWNVEFFMSVSASSGALADFYVEIYKYDGSTFTLLATNVATPEQLTNTTTVDAYFTSVAMPLSAMAVTDRLAVRIFTNVASKTVTLYTEDNRLCQVVTTFSKGMLSLNNLTDQSQYLTTGTAGTNFAIVSSGDTHTFNLPIASATNTGKLSSTDWSTFNNKQNTITDPITGTGASTQIAYFNSGTSITSEAAFNYDASTNRLGVNTSVPNATIGANAATDSGYSLLLKNDNANYNGIGFATDSTYGNLIATEKLGTALTRNLTLLNQSGYISLTEAGNLGVGILTPNTGLDIYNGTSAYLWLHTANSGITGTDGVRLALFNTNGANLRNYEGAFSITAEGDFSIITIGAENFRVNSADGSIYQSKVANAMLKSVSGVITAAVAGTDYVLPSALTGYVPTSRTLTINGTAYDLSADRSWSVGTMGGSGVSGRVAYYDGTNSITSEAGFIYDASTNRLGVNTTVPNATIGADSALDSGYGLLVKTGSSNYNGIGIAVDSTYGNLISTEKLGSASARNLTLLNQSGFVSLTESGNLGLNVLTPAVSGNGIDIYGSTSVGLRFHTAASGTTVSDGAGINFSAANNLGITNYEAGAIDIVTNGNSGVFIASTGLVGINGATPSVALTVNGAISQTSVTSSLLKTDSGGLLIAAVAGTDYVTPSALSSYVPTSRTLTINGTTYDLSANRSWTITTGVTGSGTTDYLPKFTGSTSIGNSAITDDGTTVTLISRVLAAPRARLNNGYDNASLILNVGGQTYMDSRTSRLYQTYNLSSMSNYMHVYDPYSTVNANGGFSIGASTSVTLLPSTSIIHFDGVNNRVGVGTTAPTRTFSVTGTSYFNGTFTLAGGAGFNYDSLRFAYSNGTSSNNIYSGGADGLNISNQADTEILMRVTNTGNVGIGTINPDVTGFGWNTLTIRGGTTSGEAGVLELQTVTTNTNGQNIGIMAFMDGSSRNAQISVQRDTSTSTANMMFYTNAGGGIVERMRITSGGNVGIGTTTTTNGLLSLRANTNDTIALVFQPTGSQAPSSISNFLGTNQTFTVFGSNAYVTNAGNIARFNTSYAGCFIALDEGDISFGTGTNGANPGQKMRISSLGQISQTATLADWSYVISNNNASSPNGMIIQYTNANKNNTGNQFLYCTDNSGASLRMEVRSNGGIANYQANDVNLSDERTKKDIIPLESYWNKFKAIEIVKFKYKDQTHDDFNIGVIAQQVESIAPEFIDIDGWGKTPEGEEPLKSVYTADLHHATIKVLQEAMAKIESLEARIKQLENK